MNPFLEDVAKKIIQEHENELDQIHIVLPNRRTGLFLKKHLALLVEKPFFSPEISSIEDFVVELTGIQIEDPIYLLFTLFQIHKELEGDRMLHFMEFAAFGEMLIHDFSDIDSHLVDPKVIFSWLSEEKALSLWNVSGQPLTENQKNYLRFFSLLGVYYQKLVDLCIQKNKIYQGYIYRYAAENIENLINRLQVKKIWIVGFNALTKSEYRIFHYLEQSGKAEILWDADVYYMESAVQESGDFLRRYQSQFKNLKDFSNCFSQPKNIEVIGVSENILQAKFTGQKIDQLIDSMSNMENSAIVLCDENLLLPVLNSLPSRLESVNITMGYPFCLTSIYDLGIKLLDLHSSRSKSSLNYFNRQSVLLLLTHPYLQMLFSPEYKATILLEKLTAFNRAYLSVDEIQHICNESNIDFNALCFLFIERSNVLLLFQTFDTLINLFWEKVENKPLEKEFLFTFYKLITHLKDLQDSYQAFDSMENIKSVYTSLAERIKINFYGEPLQGLQVMGLLETRVIDFENIILLSVNEGTLPKGKTSSSLLPFQIKKHFEIPTYSETDSIYAYHFYRLLQRAKNITLVYNADTEGFGKNEKSRFIKQIQLELNQYSPHTMIVERLLTATGNPQIEKNNISVVKNDIIQDQLNSIASGKGFSPTSLNCYIRCPLQFYFTHILKIPEIKTVEETVDYAVLGTVIHSVMENIFLPERYSDGLICPETLQSLKKQTNDFLVRAFDKEYPQGDLQTGKNKLIFEIAQKIINTFIEKQQELARNSKLEILALEIEMRGELEIEAGENKQKINLYGKADRIDRLDGNLRIVDYKSGNVQDSDLKVKSIELDNFNKSKIPEKSFQLLLYSWLYIQSKGIISSILSGIYSFRRMENDLLTVKIDANDNISNTEIQTFETFLTQLLTEIFDREIPFTQTQDEKTCSYCPFVSICGK